jgi:hypothetical protein
LVRRAYREWAVERRVDEDGHDAAYRGVIDDLSVRVETGVRDSGAYDVVVEVAAATGLAPGVHRLEKRAGEDPRARAFVDHLAEIAELISLRTSPDQLIVRLDPGTLPEAVDEVLDCLRHALVEMRASLPYR